METQSLATIEEVLREAGVTPATLGSEEKRALDNEGYLILPGVIDQSRVKQWREAFEGVAAQERQAPGRKETGTRHPPDLLNRGKVFEEVCTTPKVLAAIHYVLGRSFRLSQGAGRDPLPGYGQQGLHADWLPRQPKEPFYVVTTLWMLDDFTRDNGATRLVPGTHRLPGQVPKAMADPASHHLNELIVTAPAGSVLLFNGHLWHSGTRNNSQLSRRALQCIFQASESFPPDAITGYDKPEEFSRVARYILGA